MKHLPILLAATALAGCAVPPGTFTAATQNASLVQGPPIEDVVTSFDDALTCLRSRIPTGIAFAVGQVSDATGKESYADGGTGKFVTQGAGEMVQSALFRAGVSVVNRRDSHISTTEANWGIRDIRRQVPVNFFVSGSINSLDFIPGGGLSAQVGGIGPRYRQNRILVALDLTLTDAYTGRLVASVPLQKQIFTREVGGSASTFFGQTLIQLEAGGMEREALHFALRQMLSLATFELLGQLMTPAAFADCRAKVSAAEGMVKTVGTADRTALAAAIRSARQQEALPPAPPLAVPISNPDASPEERAALQQVAQQVALQRAQQRADQAQQPQGQGVGQDNRKELTPQQRQAQQPAAAAPTPTDGERIGRHATLLATEAIRAARDSERAENRSDAIRLAADALQKSNDSLRLLQRAAELGYNGDEGEVTAVVVQQALQAAQRAGTAAAARESDRLRIQREAAGAAGAPAAETPEAGPVPAIDATPAPPPAPEAPSVPGPTPEGGPVEDRRRMGGRQKMLMRRLWRRIPEILTGSPPAGKGGLL